MSTVDVAMMYTGRLPNLAAMARCPGAHGTRGSERGAKSPQAIASASGPASTKDGDYEEVTNPPRPSSAIRIREASGEREQHPRLPAPTENDNDKSRGACPPQTSAPDGQGDAGDRPAADEGRPPATPAALHQPG